MSFDAVRQLPIGHASPLDLLPCATIPWGAAKAASRLNLAFETDEDDFDQYEAAIIQLEMPEPAAVSTPWRASHGFAEAPASFATPLTFMLHRYAHEPENTLTIFLPRRAAAGPNLQTVLDRITTGLGLPEPAWQSAGG